MEQAELYAYKYTTDTKELLRNINSSLDILDVCVCTTPLLHEQRRFCQSRQTAMKQHTCAAPDNKQLVCIVNTYMYVLLTKGPGLSDECWMPLLDLHDDAWIFIVTWDQPLADIRLLRHDRVETVFYRNSTIQQSKYAMHWSLRSASGQHHDYSC